MNVAAVAEASWYMPIMLALIQALILSSHSSGLLESPPPSRLLSLLIALWKRLPSS